MRSKVILRADAGANIGYGHFVRTLALADMLKKSFDCTFYSIKPSKYQLDEMAKVCKSVPLNSDSPNEDFLSFMTGDEIVVLDNYYFGSDYQREVKKKGCKLVCISTLQNVEYFCDVLFSPDPYPTEAFNVQAYTHVYSGFEWAFLRRAFREGTSILERKKKRSTIQKVLISLGGSDIYGVTDKILSIPDLEFLDVDVLVGDRTSLQHGESSNIHLHKNASASEIVELMRSADLGIFSASSICNEAMAMRLPVAIGYYAENQRLFHDLLVDNENAVSIGNFLDIKCINGISKLLHSTISYKGQNIDFSTQEKKIINIFKQL